MFACCENNSNNVRGQWTEKKSLARQSMTNCTGHYRQRGDYVNGIKINVSTWEYGKRCRVAIVDFHWEKLSSSEANRSSPIGNQEIFNSRGCKSRRKTGRCALAVIATPQAIDTKRAISDTPVFSREDRFARKFWQIALVASAFKMVVNLRAIRKKSSATREQQCKSRERYSLFASRINRALIYLSNRRCRSRAWRNLFMTLLTRVVWPVVTRCSR